MSPVAKLRQSRREQGLCIDCGAPRHPESRCMCGACVLKRRVYVRERIGAKPWAPGRKGRKPITVPE